MNKHIAVTVLALGLVMPLTAKKNYVVEVIDKRHSGYTFDTTRSVTSEQLQTLIKAGQLAPSSYNDQPWYFIICDRTTHPEAFGKALSTLVEFNQKWAVNAPVLIIVLAAPNSHRGEFNRWAQYDTGAAAYSMALQATSMGLMAHQMGGFDEAKIIKLFGLPATLQPMAVMAVGYAGQETKTVKRDRKPMHDNFFIGAWGAGAKTE